jgi:hypothetical protein
MPQRTLPRIVALLATGLFVSAGCQRDEIQTYTVPKPAADTAPPKVRLLAAVLENGKDQWFFKLVGPVEAVGQHGNDFAKFVESVRFTGKAKPPIEWTVPAGWVKGPEKEPRYATFFPAGEGKAPEVTVSKLGKRSSLHANVVRWCQLDLGRKPPREGELAQFTKSFKAGKHTGTLVDMTGPGPKKGQAPPMADSPVRPGRSPTIKYEKPEGWTDTGARGGIVTVLASFRVADSGQSAEVTVLPLSGQTGGLLANINRWREQVGLGEITQAQFDRDPPRSVKVAELPGQYYDFTGPAGAAQKRMLLVTVKRGEQTWYFKMVGPAGVVGKNKSKFESFVQSVKFTGAEDE